MKKQIETKQIVQNENLEKSKSELLAAAANKEWDLVVELIKQGADINAIYDEEGRDKGKSVLWFAAAEIEWGLVVELIKQGADINATCTGEGTDKGISVLWLAADNHKWGLVGELIEKGANINATCTGEGRDKGISVLWLAALGSQWDLVAELIEKGADIKATCTGENLHKGDSVLSMAYEMAYDYMDSDLQESNKNIFYFLYATFIWKKELESSINITLWPKDSKIIDGIKNEICNHIKIFTPNPIYSKAETYRDDWIYQRDDWIYQLPEGLKNLLSRECIKKTLLENNFSMICVEFFSNKINRCIFNDESFHAERTDAQNGPGHCHYALVLFSNILTILRDDSGMFDVSTRSEMQLHKKMLNQQIFKGNFLPAYNKSANNDISFTHMSRDKRQQLYETSKKYGNSKLDKKPKDNILTENDFTAIFENMKF